MATLKDRLDALNIMIGKKVNKLYEISEKSANKTTTLTGHTAADSASKFPNVDAVNAGLNLKVDKVTGKQLSTEDFTTEFKNKLTALESSKFRGKFIGTDATALPTTGNTEGSYADLDSGVAGESVTRWIWDNNDSVWVEQVGASTELTASEIKTLYESNADTNAFTDAYKNLVDTNATDITALENELTTWYKAIGTEFPDYATALNSATPNIVVA